MSQSSKIVIAVLATIILVGTCCCCGSLVYVAGESPTWDAADAQAGLDGAELGRSATAEECINSAIARDPGCGLMDALCKSQLAAFTQACLTALPQPPSDLCVSIPATSMMGEESLQAGEAFCAARGHPMSAGCDAVFVALSEHCDALRARGSR
ncbi:MAG: hypothetical protein KC593_02220 [Myxococcales bacterium]|nr:hypothetical protein [Myxococcales bacterium]MCB9629307.1 hypothetical protein [Sandaracinaceae bacterium]